MGLPTTPEGLCTWKSRPFCPALGYSVVSALGRPTVSQQDSAYVAALGPRSTCFNGIREGFPKTSSLAFHRSFEEKTVRASSLDVFQEHTNRESQPLLEFRVPRDWPPLWFG